LVSGTQRVISGSNIAAGLLKTAQSGAREPKKSESFESTETKVEIGADPMTTAVQQLTTTLGNLGLQMRQMHSSIEELQGQGQKEP
jgi:TolA-binding protein